MLWSSADTGFSTNGLLNVTPLTSTWSSDSTNSWSKINFLFVYLFVQYISVKTKIYIVYVLDQMSLYQGQHILEFQFLHFLK